MAKQLKLPDGRILDYGTFAAEDGFPFVWTHGTPGSYDPIPTMILACEKRGLRLVTFSRAGYGGSSRHKGRRVVDDVSDVKALLRHLGYEECYVGGLSGGGPHALACAARLEGCKAAAVFSSLPPWDAEGVHWAGGQAEGNSKEIQCALASIDACEAYCESGRKELLSADLQGLIGGNTPEADKKVILESEGVGDWVLDTFREGLKDDAAGWVDDDMAQIAHWGFELGEVKCPVFLYHGTEDTSIPHAQAEWVASRMPEKHLKKHILEGEAHISVLLNNLDKMLDELKSVG